MVVFSLTNKNFLELFDYVHWYNHVRIHSSLDYQTPAEYKATHL
ncbi:IS3 family transposase [Aquibacillus sediminis]